MAHSESASWPPEATHWGTRLGLTLPAALAVRILGPRPLAFVLWPLLAGMLKIPVCLRIAEDFCDRHTAYLAAALLAVFPLEVIFSTHLFPDVVVGLLSALSIWYWIRALRRDDARDYLLSGAFFAAGYLCRETVVMDGPIYMALWIIKGRARRPRMAWVTFFPILVTFLELGVYAATTGSPFYRWVAIRSQQGNSAVIAVSNASQAGGNFWTDPLLLAVTSHEFGLYLASALILAPLAWLKWPSCRPLVVWLIVGFLWVSYGTTTPSGWLTLPREARYHAALTVPCVILLARFMTALGRRLRWTLAGILLASGLLATSLDRGNMPVDPHRQFILSKYSINSAVEPFDYVACRWVLGFTEEPAFDCAVGCGHPAMVREMATQVGTRLKDIGRARYLAFSPGGRPDLLRTLTARGWKVVARFPGRPGRARGMIAHMLMLYPSQRWRAEQILNPSGLLVLRCPERPGATAEIGGQAPGQVPGDVGLTPPRAAAHPGTVAEPSRQGR